jgi:GMP synthase-like glutamine amidotransferase
MPSCLVIQHVAPESCYAIADALTAVDVEIVLCRTYADEPLPQCIGGFDGFVVMGGPMSATSDEGFASRRHEMRLLAESVGLSVPTLGVCLGAQLLAEAGGGRVVARPDACEIGWAPVRFGPAAATDPLFSAVPAELTVLHWHSDTYELPPGGVHLASSPVYEQQAFRLGDRAWGIQFHLEVDEAAVAAFLTAFGEETSAAGTSPDALRAVTHSALANLVPYRDQVLARFASLVAGDDRSGEEPARFLSSHRR